MGSSSAIFGVKIKQYLKFHHPVFSLLKKPPPPLRYPPRNKALLRAYENHWFPLIRGWLITLSPIIMEVENGYI